MKRHGPSLRLVIGLLVLALGLLLIGELFFSSGRRSVTTTWRDFPTYGGILLLLADGVLALVWLGYQRKNPALEEGMNDPDQDKPR